MLTLDVLKQEHLATTGSGPAVTERGIVSEHTFTSVAYSITLEN